jgi:hypothetical protein
MNIEALKTVLGGQYNAFLTRHRVTISCYFLVFLLMEVWQIKATGGFSLLAVFANALYLMLCFSFGRSGMAVVAIPSINNIRFVFQIVVGYFLFNTLFFIITLLSPIGLYANFTILIVLAVGLEYFCWNRHAVPVEQEWLPTLLAILASGISATIWCMDAQSSPAITGDSYVYQFWQDTFYHVRVISAFQQAHGIHTISNVMMSGFPVAIYHYAMYVSAAIIAALSNISTIDVYSSFLLPYGIFLTGLAAYAVIASLLGVWPALAATLAIMFLPDSFQQGFDNRYMSYNFMSQINLGMLYGLACVAMAWLFLFDGCGRGKYKSVFVGYIFIAISIIYKAHLFVANAYLALIFPCLFFFRVKLIWRIVAAVVLTAIFVTVIKFSQHIDSIPLIRLDFSGLGSYAGAVLENYDPGIQRDYFNHVFYESNYSKALLGLNALAMVLISSFGLWLLAFPVVSYVSRRRVALPILIFPMLILANYVVMSLGLAIDSKKVGGIDELLNRPQAWASYVLIVWTSACAYYIWFGNQLPKNRVVLGVLGLVVCLLPFGTLQSAKEFQVLPTLKMDGRQFDHYAGFNQVDGCLVKASRYVRDNSPVADIIQDSENDKRFMITALAERQMFVIDSRYRNSKDELRNRLDALENFRSLQNANEIVSFAKARNISWYILEPQATVAWPVSYLDQAAYQCDGYRVFHFEY